MIQELKKKIKKLEKDTKMKKYGLEGRTQLNILKEWLQREQEIIKIIDERIWVANKQVNASESNLISNHNQELREIKEELEK